MDLHIVHIPKVGISSHPGHSLYECGLGHLVFETCLRQIAFLNSDLFIKDSRYIQLIKTHPGSIEVLSGERAYQFLLEVICGLHSLIKGETEIFGQFKEFSMQHKNLIESLNMSDLFKQLSTDCKSLRSSRIQNWNHNTYGSVTRKLITSGDAVALLGSGQLAEEIAPWLKQIKTKSLILRRKKDIPAVFDSFQTETCISPKTTVVVVAAPISNKHLQSLIQSCLQIRLVIDWRGDEQWRSINAESVFHLHDLKANDEKTKHEHIQRVQRVRDDIRTKALEFTKKAKHNPWGWEDFCA